MGTFQIGDDFVVSYTESPRDNNTQIFRKSTGRYQSSISTMTPDWVRAALAQIMVQHNHNQALEAWVEQQLTFHKGYDCYACVNILKSLQDFLHRQSME